MATIRPTPTLESLGWDGTQVQPDQWAAPRVNAWTQSQAADRRFLASTLRRYGTVHQAIQEVRHLREMAPDGQTWWSYIEARLAYLIAESQ